MTEQEHVLDGPESLRTLWRRGLKHGALLLALHPAPTPGTRLVVRLRMRGTGKSAAIEVTVADSAPGMTVMQAAPLGEAQRKALSEMGLPEALDATISYAQIPTVPAPTPAVGASAPGPAQAAAPAMTAPQPAASVVRAETPVTAPQPAPVEPPAAGAGPPLAATGMSPPPAQPPRTTFRPAPAKPPPVDVSPGAFRAPGQAPAPPPRIGTETQSGSTSRTSLAAITAAHGPAHVTTEMLLPPATEQGDLSRFPWRDALLHFLELRITGVVAVDGFRETRWAYFVDGKPVDYRGTAGHPGEYLSEALAEVAQIAPEVWQEALVLAAATGLDAGEALIRKRRLTRDQLEDAVLRRATRITRNLLGANFGRFRVHPLPDIATVLPGRPVDVLAILWTQQQEAARRTDDDMLIEKAAPLYGRRLLPAANRAWLLRELPLSPRERHIADELLPPAWTVKELIALGEVEERELLRLSLALQALGAVEFLEEDDPRGRSLRSRRHLFSAHRDLKKRDAFAVLHAHWSSAPRQIDEGHAALLQEFDPKKFPDRDDAYVHELLGRIRAIADDTRKRLSDRSGRQAARKDLVGNDQLRMAADLFDKQAEMAMFKGDFGRARLCYECVIELDPGGADGAENLLRAKQHLADPRVANAKASDLGDLRDDIDGLLL